MSNDLLKRLRHALVSSNVPGGLLALIKDAADEIEDGEKLAVVHWEADMRGVRMWRAANPGNELVLPDQAKLVEWMLNKIASQAADIEVLTGIANKSINRGQALGVAAEQFDLYARNHRYKAEYTLSTGPAHEAFAKAHVNEQMAAMCRSAIGNMVEMTAGDLGGVEIEGALHYPHDLGVGVTCLTCVWRDMCIDLGKCRRDVIADRAAA